MLALVSHKRSPEMIGREVVRYDIYSDEHQDYCMEERTRLGRTWVEDERLFIREVDMDFCLTETKSDT